MPHVWWHSTMITWTDYVMCELGFFCIFKYVMMTLHHVGLMRLYGPWWGWSYCDSPHTIEYKLLDMKWGRWIQASVWGWLHTKSKEWNHVSYVKDMSNHEVWRAGKKEVEPKKNMVLWTTSTVRGDNLILGVSCWYGIMDLWGRVVICIRCGWAMGLW